MEPPVDAGGRAPADVWRWGATSPYGDWPYMDSLARAMRRAPAMRLLICTGLFDLTTTIGAARHAVRQSALLGHNRYAIRPVSSMFVPGRDHAPKEMCSS
ncbi:hypothetical protein ACIBO5_39770 [Nonomuraea angiospora]|uniref:hypothetical protein n=1 Tax=Nonomuraea angiospora TaxID=46172 RepID=UPI0037960AC2